MSKQDRQGVLCLYSNLRSWRTPDQGNTQAEQRYGQTAASSYGLVDNLTYTYNGNKLTRVDDAVTATSYIGGTNFINGANTSNEYVYDQNGNLTKDLNKGIRKRYA